MASSETQRRLSDWFRRWHLPLRKFLSASGAVGSADLDDVAQEVFLRLLRYERAELVENPQAYLFKMAANVASEWTLRARSRHPHAPEWLLDLTADSQPEDEAARVATQELIARAVQRLPLRQRELLRLHFAEGLSYAQIASRVSTSQRAVKRQLANSYAQLRSGLAMPASGVRKHGSE